MNRAAWTILALTALAAGACGHLPAPAGRTVVVTEVPVHLASRSPEPGQRYPAGSRLVAVDLENTGAAPRVLTGEMDAAGGARISPDGQRMVFVGRQRETDSYSVWVAQIDGSGRHRLPGPENDCGAAAFLPDGRVVFSAVVDGEPVGGLEHAWALFVTSEEATEAQRISFSGGAEVDPSVLADGRVVYSEWQPGGDGRPPGGSFALWTVHPDGTGAAPIHGAHDGSRQKLRARQASDGDLLFLAVDADGDGGFRRVDWRRPHAPARPVAAPEGTPFAVEPRVGGGLLLAVSSADGGRLWATGPGGGDPVPMTAAHPGWIPADAVEVASRPRPQGQLSMVDPGGDRGQLLALDARPAGNEDAARARLRVAGQPEQVLGTVPLAADGSFFAVVPANRPLLLDLLDDRGEVLVRGSTPFWVRPKEIRGCVGCHEDPDLAPPNRRPLAVLDDPVELLGEESRG